MLATLLLLLAPASALADKGYIVKLSDDGKTLTYTYDEEPTAEDANCWTLTKWIEGKNAYELSDEVADVTKVVFDASFAEARPTSTRNWFWGMANLTTIEGLKNLNTSEVTDMSLMFQGCKILQNIDLSGFNTVKVEKMQRMFHNCYKLKSITFGDNFNTANVTDMSFMFSWCEELNGLNLSGFNTDKVTSMESMFYNCKCISSLNLSSFNTANVTNMNSMFACCSVLKSLDISGFNTTKVTDVGSMFSTCNKLKALNLGNNDFKDATATEDAFNSINSDCKLTVGAGFDVTVLGAADETSGKYTWLGGTFTLQQLTLDENNAEAFAAAGNQEGGITYPKVVLKRSFNPEAWNTLVVPFGISDDEATEQFGEDVKMAKYKSVERNSDGTYTLHFETITSVEAHQPVLIYGVTTKTEGYTFADKAVTSGTPEVDGGNLKLVGTYVAGNVPQGNYFLDSENKLWLAADATNTIKATRATFRPIGISGAKTATFVIDGETTAINLPATVGIADGAAYNLQGQRVGDDYKGVVIRNGRKYVRK